MSHVETACEFAKIPLIVKYIGVTVRFTQSIHIAKNGNDDLEFGRKLWELSPYIFFSALSKASGGFLPALFGTLNERVQELQISPAVSCRAVRLGGN